MFRVCAVLLGLIVLVGCGGSESGIEPVNQPPTIAFTTPQIAVSKGIPIDLTVSVSDPNADDNLSVSWSITSGTLTPQNAEKTIMRWVPPSTLGADTVVVTVTDGEETASVTEEIKRGTTSVANGAQVAYVKSASPYILAPAGSPPRITVSGGQTTTIEAGVEIYLDLEETIIDVEGTLVAAGTAAEPVLIRPNDRTLRCGDRRGWWDGIQVKSEGAFNGRVVMDYADVEYAIHNLQLTEQAVAILRNCAIKCGQAAGLKISGVGSLIVRNSEVSNNASNGIEVSAFSSLPDSVTITGCQISYNGSSGIHLELTDLFQQVPITISQNRIEFNFENGILLQNAVFPDVHYNEIWSNNFSSASNVRLRPGFPGGAAVDTLLMTNNYWGGAYSSPATIEATITDSADRVDIGTRVIIDPWLNTSPIP